MVQDIDSVDKKILEILHNDAKTNIKAISAELGLSKSPVYERIKRLENSGIIDKYSIEVNRKLLGKSLLAFCFVSLETQQIKEIEKFTKAVSKIDEVLECYLMAGQNDFMLKVIVKDLDAYHGFSSGKLAALPNVSKIKSSFVLNEVKRTSSLGLFDSDT